MSTSGSGPEVSCRLLEGGSVNDGHRPQILTVSLTFCDYEGWLAPGYPAGLVRRMCTSGFARGVIRNPISGRLSPRKNRELNARTSSPVLANFVTFAQFKAVSHTDSNIEGPSKGSHAAPGCPLSGVPELHQPLCSLTYNVGRLEVRPRAGVLRMQEDPRLPGSSESEVAEN